MKLLYSFVITLILFSVVTLTDAADGKDQSTQAVPANHTVTVIRESGI